MMNRVRYVTRFGETRVYEYPPGERDDAEKKLRRALSRSVVRLFGTARWRAGTNGHVFNGATVNALIRRGEAVRFGDEVRAAT
jgi:hypothetical protein